MESRTVAEGKQTQLCLSMKFVLVLLRFLDKINYQLESD